MARSPTAPRPPQRPVLDDDMAAAATAAPGHDDELSGRLEEPDWSTVAARGVRLRELAIAGGRLAGAQLSELSAVDVFVERCDAANLGARGASLGRVEIVASRLTGADLGDARLRDVTLRDCRIDLAGFRFARFERVRFEDCVLRGADFGGATLTSVVLERCDLEGADLSGAEFSASELRDCALESVRGVERLRGVAMPWPDVVRNAGAFAGALGIRLLDED